MPGGTLGDELREFVGPGEIAGERVANDDGKRQEDAIFQHALAHLDGCPRPGLEGPTFAIIAVDEALDAPEQALQKDRLWTSPATPQAPQRRGDNEEREANAGQHEEQQRAVLGVEGQTKEMK